VSTCYFLAEQGKKKIAIAKELKIGEASYRIIAKDKKQGKSNST
jgi:hypothetical protein